MTNRSFAHRWRVIEQKLLFFSCLYLLTGICALLILQPTAVEQGLIITALIAAVLFFAVSTIWSLIGFKGDPYLLPLAATLCFTSLVFLQRLNPVYAQRQFTWLVIGLAALVATTMLVKIKSLAEYKYVFATAGAVALLLPIFFGVERGGAKSWLLFGPFSIQTSEFVKILLVLFFASYLSERRQALAQGRNMLGITLPQVHDWGPLLMMLGASLTFLVFQKDLGTTLIFFCTFLAMVYVGTARLSYIFFAGVLFTAGSSAAYFVFGHVRTRVEAWLDPWQYAATSGYQVLQSLFAFTAGGFAGTGLGAGFPHLIPAVHTDFIFAAIAEETGLAGALGLLLVYMILFYRGFIIALEAEDDFTSLLTAGLTALLGLQSFIIMAGVTKLLPLTGVTLPFVSYGGSSLVANFIILGLILNVSNYQGRSAVRH